MPPAIETIDSQENATHISAKRRAVIVHLSDINYNESITDRFITLQHPSWTVDIGRGSCTDESIVPEPNNAWFTSKVMSRQHATLKADPDSLLLTLKDTGSMHGTYLNGEKITGQEVEVLSNDVITFGTDVIRHAESFAPLRTKIDYEWEIVPETQTGKDRSNTFTADYSEEDNYSDFDDEVMIVHDSIRQPSIEILDHDPSLRYISSTSASPNQSSDIADRASPPHPTSYARDYNSESVADENIPDGQREQENPAVSESYGDDKAKEGHLDESLPEFSDDDSDNSLFEEDFRVTYVHEQIPSFKPNTIRQPSPSDAAMAKPRHEDMSKSPQCPTHSTSASLGPAYIPAVPTFTTFGTPGQQWSWDGSIPHTVAPFESRAHMSCNSSHQIPFPSYTPSVPDFPHPPLPRIGAIFSPTGNIGDPTMPTYRPSSPPSANTFPARTLKRKAADISVSQPSKEDASSNTAVEGSDTVVKETLTDAVAGQDNAMSSATMAPSSPQIMSSQTVVADECSTKETAVDPVTAITKCTTSIIKGASIVVEPVEDELQEPPRKRLRSRVSGKTSRQGGSALRTAVKYTATALAGVSIGAVGAVLSLASLPPDYFA